MLEALGIDVEIREGDVAARGNFCTLDDQGKLLDRRAGRISSQESVPLCEQLDQIDVPGLEVRILPVQDYRFVALFRGEGLSENVTETDPQALDVTPRRVEALDPAAQKTAEAANALIEGAREILGDRDRANMVLLRGFSQLPHLPGFGDSYRLNPAAIAAYPMYRGLSTVAGMNVIPTGATFGDEVATLEEHFAEHDFFYIHYKPAGRGGRGWQLRGEGAGTGGGGCLHPAHPGTAAGRVGGGRRSRHALDSGRARLATPCRCSYTQNLRWERACPPSPRGRAPAESIGSIPATHLMFLALAHAGKLVKFGP